MLKLHYGVAKRSGGGCENRQSALTQSRAYFDNFHENVEPGILRTFKENRCAQRVPDETPERPQKGGGNARNFLCAFFHDSDAPLLSLHHFTRAFLLNLFSPIPLIRKFTENHFEYKKRMPVLDIDKKEQSFREPVVATRNSTGLTHRHAGTGAHFRFGDRDRFKSCDEIPAGIEDRGRFSPEEHWSAPY